MASQNKHKKTILVIFIIAILSTIALSFYLICSNKATTHKGPSNVTDTNLDPTSESKYARVHEKPNVFTPNDQTISQNKSYDIEKELPFINNTQSVLPTPIFEVDMNKSVDYVIPVFEASSKSGVDVNENELSLSTSKSSSGLILEAPKTSKKELHLKYEKNQNRMNVVKIIDKMNLTHLRPLPSFIDKYDILEYDNNGAMKMKARSKADHKLVTIRYTYLNRLVFRHEYKILSSLNHPNILRVIELDSNHIASSMVTEVLEEDLQSYLERGALKDWESVKSIIYQILVALAYLEEQKVLVAFLNPKSIMIKNGKIKLFRFPKATTEFKRPFSHIQDLGYSAPEYTLHNMNFSYPADIWSVGVILIAMATKIEKLIKNSKYRSINEIQEYLWFLHYEYRTNIFVLNDIRFDNNFWFGFQKKLSIKLEENGLDFLKKVFTVQPEERIKAKDALKHPFFDSVKK